MSNVMASRSHRTPATEAMITSATQSSPLDTTACHHDQCVQRTMLIRLSNAAVDLLHRHENCRHCIDTLKDALAVMKHSPHDVSDATTDSIMEAWARTAARLSQALEDQVCVDSAENEPRNDTFVTDSQSPLANGLGVLVLSSRFDPEEAYHLLALRRTSKVCLTMDSTDPTIDLALARSILVYNYGIAHRCCSIESGTVRQQQPLEQPAGSEKCNKLETFCLQIFQYSETLLPTPPLDNAIESTNHNLLFRLILTRNLMMLSCRLGLSLCEHYKETLDPIVSDILGPLVHLQTEKGTDNDGPPGASAA